MDDEIEEVQKNGPPAPDPEPRPPEIVTQMLSLAQIPRSIDPDLAEISDMEQPNRMKIVNTSTFIPPEQQIGLYAPPPSNQQGVSLLPPATRCATKTTKYG